MGNFIMNDFDIIVKFLIGGFMLFLAEYIRGVNKNIKFSIEQNEKIWIMLEELKKEFHILFGEHKKNHE
jgi:hypothetical protein